VRWIRKGDVPMTEDEDRKEAEEKEKKPNWIGH
jgi:hypothetical protein